MITFKQKGDFKNTERFLKGALSMDLRTVLNKYGQIGVEALSRATPVDTGLTASSWTYEIGGNRKYFWISWSNTHLPEGIPIAIMLQYGHGTGTGGYVQGRDYINPAMRSIFDRIAEDVWGEVSNL